MKSQKLIVKTRPATSAICPGCERDCLMPVFTVRGKSGDSASFIVCDKRSDINRVPIPPAQLIQWRCNADSVCSFIADSLGLRRSESRANHTDQWEIGIATGDKRSQMLCLQANGSLLLVAGNNAVPLAEFIGYQDDVCSLDATMTRQLVDAATTVDKRYTPTIARREARKLDTQAMYERWQKEYRKLKKADPKKSDTGCSLQIAKLDIAQGWAYETIRKT
ncbi:MAG: hypothetical protein O7D86_03440 [Proteobacteria bacterium]|nr:hypothetical protein [Pseudomonadota bacterium]